MVSTAALAVPLGIAAALYLEEFADKERWCNRLIEVNLQNLAAVPSIVYGLLAVAVDGADRLRPQRHRHRRRDRAGAADPAGHHHHHPRGGARRAAGDPAGLARPRRDRRGRRPGGRPCRRPSRASRPARSSASRGRSARPRRCVVLGLAGSVRFDPDRTDQPVHGAADPDLQPLLPVAGGAPQRRLGRHHRPAGDDPRPQRASPSSSATSSSEPGRSSHHAQSTPPPRPRVRVRTTARTVEHARPRSTSEAARDLAELPPDPVMEAHQPQRLLRRLPRRPRRQPAVREATRSPR